MKEKKSPNSIKRISMMLCPNALEDAFTDQTIVAISDLFQTLLRKHVEMWSICKELRRINATSVKKVFKILQLSITF